MMKWKYILLRSLISLSISYIAKVFNIDLYASILLIFFITLRIIRDIVFIGSLVLFFYGFFTKYNKPECENLFIISRNARLANKRLPNSN